MEQHDFYVYLHTRLNSGIPFYVGKGRKKRAGARSKRNPHWWNIVRKDDGFGVSFVAKDMDEELAFLVEIETIDKCRRLGIPLTNKTLGGEGSFGAKRSEESRAKMRDAAKHKGPVSDETRRKMSVALVGNSRRKGIPHTEETKAKLRMRRHSPEAKKRMSDSRKGHVSYKRTEAQIQALRTLRVGVPSPNRGIPASEETKAKLRAAWDRRRLTPEALETNRRKSEFMKKVWEKRRSDAAGEKS